MAYAPGVTDISGQLMGQGILQAMQSLSMGLEKAKARTDEMKKLEAENKALELLVKNNAQSAGLTPQIIESMIARDPEETPAARNAKLKAAGAGILTRSQLESENQRRALALRQMGVSEGTLALQGAQTALQGAQTGLAIRQAATEEERQAMRREAAAAALAPKMQLPNAAAVGLAFNSGGALPVPSASMEAPGVDEAVRSYIQRTGDMAGAENLAQAAMRAQPVGARSAAEALAGVPTGMQVSVQQNAQGRWLAQGTTKDKGTEEIQVGDRKLTYHKDSKKYFDETGKPVNFGPAYQPRPPAFELKQIDPELFEAQREEYLAFIRQGGHKAAQGGGAPAPAKGDGSSAQSPVKVTTAEEHAKLKKGTWYIDPNGAVAQKR